MVSFVSDGERRGISWKEYFSFQGVKERVRAIWDRTMLKIPTVAERRAFYLRLKEILVAPYRQVFTLHPFYPFFQARL